MKIYEHNISYFKYFLLCTVCKMKSFVKTTSLLSKSTNLSFRSSVSELKQVLSLAHHLSLHLP